jgi:hypothetical protein
VRGGHLGQRRADLLHALIPPECCLAAGGVLLQERWAAKLVPHAVAGLALQARDTPHADCRWTQGTLPHLRSTVMHAERCAVRDRSSASRILAPPWKQDMDHEQSD